MKIHIFITGVCGAGKSTLARALAQLLQYPLQRLDDDPAFRQLLPYEPDLNRWTDPRRYAQWQALRQALVAQAAQRPTPTIIEGTQILALPAATLGHRCILVDTPLHQIVRQLLARERANYARDPVQYAAQKVGPPGSVTARQRAWRARQVYEGLRPELDAFRQLPGVVRVPRRAFTSWLLQQAKTKERP